MREGEEGLSDRHSNVSKGLDQMWGLRDRSMFPEMGGTNGGR